MNPLTRTSILIVMVLTLSQCKSTQQTSSQEEGKKMKSIVLRELGENANCYDNNSGMYTLCYNADITSKNLGIYYLVYNKSTGEIILEKTFLNGKVKWSNDTWLEISEHKGISTTDGNLDTNTYLLEIITKERRSSKI